MMETRTIDTKAMGIQVARFFEVFEKPKDHLRADGSLSVLYRTRRAGFMLEELAEFAAADDLVGQLDAIADLVYFVVGTAVAAGRRLSARPYRYKTGCPPSCPARDFRVMWVLKVAAVLEAFVGATDLRIQMDKLDLVMAYIADALAAMNVLDFGAVFDAVHEANMTKVWADGRVHYREGDGKVIKPEGWVGPEVRITAVVDSWGR